MPLFAVTLLLASQAVAETPTAPKGCEARGPAACVPTVPTASEEDIKRKGQELMLREQVLFERVKKSGLTCGSAESLMRSEGRLDLAHRFSEKCNK